MIHTEFAWETADMVADRAVVIRWGDLEPTPWKNGGGLTREIASSPEGSNTSDFDWRVSIADVEAAGPFSSFPGVDRVITLLEGGSMILDSESGRTVLTVREPHSFPGEASVTCELPDGSTRDLNLMTRRGQASGDVSIHTVSSPMRIDGDGSRRLVVALEDGVDARESQRSNWTLDCFDVLDTTGPLSVGPGTFALISVL
ncbi:HutD family protein [Ornithinimicrobium faecis]|uniref:HutD family protein n=1 Tax=Ornithinimicrobium faecis TaxID=2934158 RepID=A0ABY4Z011_9MICO|nr:HutD family protein [Ornithinimicrobium sp. HY1793]USQ82035.1 HutD family protein [Ornithinimicrobium sp. HY1793]